MRDVFFRGCVPFFITFKNNNIMIYFALACVFIIILGLMVKLSDRLESRIEELEEFAVKDEKRIKRNTKKIKKLSKNK